MRCWNKGVGPDSTGSRCPLLIPTHAATYAFAHVKPSSNFWVWTKRRLHFFASRPGPGAWVVIILAASRLLNIDFEPSQPFRYGCFLRLHFGTIHLRPSKAMRAGEGQRVGRCTVGSTILHIVDKETETFLTEGLNVSRRHCSPSSLHPAAARCRSRSRGSGYTARLSRG